MIHSNYSKVFSAALIGLTLTFSACSSTNEPWDETGSTPVQEQTPAKKQVKMNFLGSIQKYDQTPETRSAEEWQQGDMIYIAFHKGSSIVAGIGTYGAEGWTVDFNDYLNTGTDQVCEIRFFENASFASETVVNLNPQSIIYEDMEGNFDYDGEMLTITGTLTPKVGRIRFAGNEGEKIYTIGTTSYSSFSPNNNTYSTSAAQLESTVQADGYTPYIYGIFTNKVSPSIGMIGNDYAYTRDCTIDMLEPAASGYMAIPTKASHNKWRVGLFVQVDGVEFKMIPVTGHLTGLFLMSETEVTQELYSKVAGTNSSNGQLPITVNYSYATSFISSLSSKTKLNFKMPTGDQFEYAASGGALSQGYTYAGSNTIDDVAWYSGNAAGATHAVKSKAANELGLYDLSGNVKEWTLTPGSNSNYYVACGGDYSDPAYSCTVKSGHSKYYTESAGIRLILTCK